MNFSIQKVKSETKAQKKSAVNIFNFLKKNKETVFKILTEVLLITALVLNIVLKQKELVNTQPYRIFLGTLLAVYTGAWIAGRFNKKINRYISFKAEFFSGLLVLLIAWDILTEKSGIVPLPFFPSIAQILQSISEDLPTLADSTVSSLRLLVLGFPIGTFVGIVSGVLIGWYKKWDYWLSPVIQIIGVIPATAWIPIVMFIFPSSFYAQVFLIVLCVWFPVSFMTASGIKNLSKTYFEAAKTLGADEKFLIFKVAIPGAMPSIFTGIYTATGVSFATLVVSEMIGAKSGLGWYINWAKGWCNYGKVYASIIIMAVVFSIVMAVIFKIQDRVLRWKEKLSEN